MKRFSIAIYAACIACNLLAQTWDLAGNGSVGTTSKLGSTNTAPLSLYTGNVLRTRLHEGNSITINGFSGINQAGYLGVGRNSTFFNSPGVGAYSRLHLGDLSYPNWQGGFRPRDINGITLTGNLDHMYVGQWVEDATFSRTSALIGWSDYSYDAQTPDMLRFQYREQYNSNLPSGSPGHEFGREIAVMHPLGYFGIGDFRTAAALPTQALDVLSGKARIRSLYAENDATADRVVVVRPDGLLSSKDRNALDCKWNLAGTSLVTAFANNTNGCPQQNDQVAIGYQYPPIGKKLAVYGLDILNSTAILGMAELGTGNVTGVVGIAIPPGHITPAEEYRGISGEAHDAAWYNHGTWSRAQINPGKTCLYRNMGVESYATLYGTVGENLGVRVLAETQPGSSAGTSNGVWAYGIAYEGSTSGSQFGVYGAGDVRAGSTVYTNVGVYGQGRLESEESTQVNYGVWGQVGGATATQLSAAVRGDAPTDAGAQSWAAYFEGEGYLTGGGPWQASDEGLKQNIEDLSADESLAKLLQTQVKSYTFNTEQYGHLGLPTTPQTGFLAQELETVFPHLVRDVVHPAEYDSLGNEVEPQMTFKAVNLNGLLPVLVSGMQAMNQRIAQLQEQLAACCATDASQRSANPANVEDAAVPMARLAIAPNPFNEATTITYTVPATGRVRLQVSTVEGRPVDTLREEQTQPGEQRYVWNTTQLAPGTYLVSLLLNDEVLTERAVKVEN